MNSNSSNSALANFLRSKGINPLELSLKHVDRLIRDGHVSPEQADEILLAFFSPKIAEKERYCGDPVKPPLDDLFPGYQPAPEHYAW